VPRTLSEYTEEREKGGLEEEVDIASSYASTHDFEG